MYYVGFIYDRMKDFESAFEWYKKAADLGDTRAITKIGGMYFNGIGVDKNISEAIKYYERAAELGDSIAMDQFGECYALGLGVERNEEKALELYKKSSHRESRGIEELALTYYNSKNLDDKRLAFKYFQEAASFGETDSMYYLGKMYDKGEYIKQDDAQAFEWYLKAAEQRDIFSINAVTAAYVCDRGVEKNFAEAFKWFQKPSSHNGEPADIFYEFADYCLRNLTIDGKIEADDLEEVIKIYRKAAKEGSEQVKIILDNL